MAKLAPILLLCLLTAAAANRVSLRDVGNPGRKLQCEFVCKLWVGAVTQSMEAST